MAIANCVRCGAAFQTGKLTNICPACVAKEQADLKIVAEYLRDYPLANVIEVSERTGIPAVQIFRFVKQGSLTLTEPPEAFKCRMCGKEVKKGTLCQDCMDKVSELKDAAKKSEQKKLQRKHDEDMRRRRR